MEYIIDWETLDNEEACNSITPLGVGNLGGTTPIVLVGDRNICDGSGGSFRMASSTYDGHSRNEGSSSRVIKSLDKLIEDPAFDIVLFEDTMEIWNYDYGGS